MDVQPAKDFMAQFSKWIRLDAITRVVGFRSWVSPGVIQEILIQNDLCAFGYLLSNCPPDVVVIASPEAVKAHNRANPDQMFDHTWSDALSSVRGCYRAIEVVNDIVFLGYSSMQPNSLIISSCPCRSCHNCERSMRQST